MAKLTPKVRAARKKPGGSNVGKYPRTITFAGPSGGAPAGSYPINTKKRGESALKLAHNAPNPAGIKAKVYAEYPSLKKSSTSSTEGRYDGHGRRKNG